jgi:hypothetical protein
LSDQQYFEIDQIRKYLFTPILQLLILKSNVDEPVVVLGHVLLHVRPGVGHEIRCGNAGGLFIPHQIVNEEINKILTNREAFVQVEVHEDDFAEWRLHSSIAHNLPTPCST